MNNALIYDVYRNVGRIRVMRNKSCLREEIDYCFLV